MANLKKVWEKVWEFKIWEKYMSAIYIIAAVCSLIMLVCYCVFIKRKFVWFWVLFSSICVVNIGYFTLAVSKTLEEALLANRIAYLGSVILPLSMLLIILKATGLKYKTWLWIPLICVGGIVFFIAASPGYSDIYYKSVSLISIDGVSVLNKEYGPWHKVYMIYLLGYFSTMIIAVIHATIIKKINSGVQSIMLLGAVFINICVWAMEQFIDINFEFLAISYIITELFLIGVYVILQETENRIANIKEKLALQNAVQKDELQNLTYSKQALNLFIEGLSQLTQTEKLIYDLYINGKTTAEVLEQMNIKENTLKYHNKNIYGKLGVNSRKELKTIASIIKTVS